MGAMTTTRERVLALGLALAIFAAGVVVGATGYGLWLDDAPASSQRSPRSTAEVLDQFRAHLHLSDHQAHAIGTVLEEVHSDAHELDEQRTGHMRTLHERAREQILHLLTPEQAAAYREMIHATHRPHRH